VTQSNHDAIAVQMCIAAGVPNDQVDTLLSRITKRMQPAANAEPLVRYCPGCGHIGPVETRFHDCCPDGKEARMIPQKLAGKCRDTFQVAIRALSAEAEAKLHAQESEPVAPQPAPILYQHADGRYGLSLHGQPAAFTEGDPAWYRVPIDLVEPSTKEQP